jgi:E3 ubiquitin-protein ligase HUWE1
MKDLAVTIMSCFYLHHVIFADCSFNQLDLPEYTSKEQLQERLLLAIHEANEGFGFG